MVKQKFDIDGNPIKPQPKCIHCKKEKMQHKARTYECPTGTKTGIGYTTFGPSVFTPKQESGK